MSKKKYYAVKIGRVTGIFDNWDECKASVDSYSGADYKSFTTKQEALKSRQGDILLDVFY